jgi:hypothetical protein
VFKTRVIIIIFEPLRERVTVQEQAIFALTLRREQHPALLLWRAVTVTTLRSAVRRLLGRPAPRAPARMSDAGERDWEEPVVRRPTALQQVVRRPPNPTLGCTTLVLTVRW